MKTRLLRRISSVKLLSGLMVFAMVASIVPSSFAETTYRRVYDTQTGQYVYVPSNQVRSTSGVSSALGNPVVKQAAIGAAVGGVMGALSDKSSVGRGIGIGAIAGAGSGLVDRSSMLDNRPMVQSAVKGAIIGTGASAVSRGSLGKGALYGGAAGAGIHLLRDYLNGTDNNQYNQYGW